jgi:mRNA-degrading endonuclease RelE of RelBE toxin-antitoxin system
MTDEWTYRFTERARDELRSLDEDTAERIVGKLEKVATLVTTTFIVSHT